MKIKLFKLYSSPKIFDPIKFDDGVNLIMGEKVENSAIIKKGKKTNGVGKSMCVEFINFCLLKKSENSYEAYESADRELKKINLEKKEHFAKLDALIFDTKDLIKSFNATILNIHEYIMDSNIASFDMETVDKGKSKEIISFEMRIDDDGSHSVNRTKVFIYDMALLFNEVTQEKHPKLLIHDNIFDVDQDTLVKSLNYLAQKENQDFQYILTLNRDKIENEEREKLIKLDIKTHKIAEFTKQNRFLKVDYLEI